jgi:hypothetical protein
MASVPRARTAVTTATPDRETVLAALRLAVRAPSVHNSQP